MSEAVFYSFYTALNVPLITDVHLSKVRFLQEVQVYPRIKAMAEKKGWLYNRVETAGKDGIPDIFVARGKEYFYIEVKRLKKRQLLDVAKDLTWQYGQLAFLKLCEVRKCNYLLIVVKDNEICTMRFNDNAFYYPDFIELL